MDGTARLLAALKRGDEAAWEEAFRSLYPCAFTAALRAGVGLDRNRAEDVAIEVLSQLAAKIGEIGDWNGLCALTTTMAVRRAISERRHLSAQKRGGDRDESLDALREETEAGPGFEPPDETLLSTLSPLELAELASLLDEAFGDVDPAVRSLLHDYIVVGIPYKELAVKHGMPLGTVGVHLS
ncbi:MAG TPA: ECF-type sigma factor, partial [Candidatus Methylacidiphilales bacterium]